MPIDNLFVKGLADELNTRLQNARIDKIYMPKRDQVILNLRTEMGSEKLMLSVGSYPAVWLTSEKFENPDVPPVFCMMLRKHLGNGRIVKITQPGRERIISITVSAADEMGDISEKQLICELMGKQKNIILVNAKGIITACLRNVGLESGARGILPGLAYSLPVPDGKTYWTEISEDALKSIVENAVSLEPEKDICAAVSGMTLSMARHALKHNEPWKWLRKLADAQICPYVSLDNGEPKDIYSFRPEGECSEFTSFSEALDSFYGKKSAADGVNSAKRETEKTLNNALKRIKKRVSEQKIELQTAQDREKIKEKADLITANIGIIRSGEKMCRVINYYDENMPEITIELDPLCSPQQNAQKLYKKYARLKSAEAHLLMQIEKGEREIEYLESLIYSLRSAENTKEIDSVKAEARDSGFIRKDNKKSKKLPAAAPRIFETSGGFKVLCGRNNRENDELTHRMASKRDIWFHARGVAGSHVVLITDGQTPADTDISQAASVAAYYCALSGGVSVPVDYTEIRNVKKPNGGHPGAVNYFEYKTALVKPELPKTE